MTQRAAERLCLSLQDRGEDYCPLQQPNCPCGQYERIKAKPPTLWERAVQFWQSFIGEPESSDEGLTPSSAEEFVEEVELINGFGGIS